MPIEGADFFVHIIPFPVPIGGFVTPNDDGTYSMYLNANQDEEHLWESYWHEYEHIAYDDFYTDLPIEVIEGR